MDARWKLTALAASMPDHRGVLRHRCVIATSHSGQAFNVARATEISWPDGLPVSRCGLLNGVRTAARDPQALAGARFPSQ